jgi:IS4 transposase
MGMLWNALSVLKLDRKDILVFDRYYASHLLIFYLHKRGVQFCFRMKDNWYEVQRFLRSGLESDDLIINLPARDQRKADELGIKEKRFKCRLLKVQLDSGETEILLTSLTNETKITVADLYELYGLRWFVEEAFKTFKHKVCLENFSGKSDKAVLQDFYVKIFLD